MGLTKTGGIGAGSSDSTNSQGVGIGTFHDYGPEFTITFSTNPGILKTIELDTSQVTNTGVTDYWVANMRQGQFNSRYSQNLGRVNTLIYGSKYLYTNEDISGSVAANTLVKVGGQEFLVEDYSQTLASATGAYSAATSGTYTDPSKSFRLTLSEPFLGTSIIPVLTDTGAVATSINSAGVGGKPNTGGTAWAKAAPSSDYLELVASTITTANTDSLVSGSDLFVSGCPLTSMQNQFKMATDQAYLEIFHTECLIDFTQVDSSNPATLPIFRRSDDPSNQNVYKTTADTAKFAASGYCFSRGSTRVYPCQYHGITDATSANAIRGGSSAHADAGTATLAAGATDYSTTGPAHPYQFVDNLGPFKVSSYASATAIKYDVTQMDGISKFYTASDYAKVSLNIYQVIDDADDLPAGSILLMNGRRYKTAAAQTSGSGEGGIALTETFAGS